MLFLNCIKGSRIIQKTQKTIESSGYAFVHLVDKKVAISTSGTADGEKYFFQESIRRKTKKLEQYKNNSSNFKKIGLAIILSEIPTSYAETKLSEWLSESLKESDNLFCDFPSFLYLLRCSEKHYGVGVKLPHPVDGRSAGCLRSSSPVTKIKKGENND